MKKESLQITTVKTLLAVLLFAGVGTIIIGGGYIIGEYSKNKTDNQITKPVNQEENYYDVLEKKCGGDSCCLDILEFMQEYNYKETDEKGNCPGGFYRVIGKNCEHLLRWCVPIEESYCIDEQDNRRELGEIVSESSTMFKRCDRFGNISNYYVLSCSDEKLVISNGFGVINRKVPSESFSVGGEGTLGFTLTVDNNKYRTFSGGPGTFFASCDKEKAIIFYSHPVEMGSNDYIYNKRFFDGNSVVEISCSYQKEISGVISKFEDSKRVYNFKSLKNEKEVCQEIKERYQKLEETVVDTSDWQTYRNEEFGFEVKYPEEWIKKNIEDVYFDIQFRKDISFDHPRKFTEININMNKNSEKLSLKEIISDFENGGRIYEQKEYITINDKKVFKAEITNWGMVSGKQFLIVGEKYWYDIVVDGTNVEDNEIDQIFSTFKFTQK